MDLTGKLKAGMRIVGPDHTEYGTVERYDDTAVYVDGRPIPYGAFVRLDQDRLYVGQDGARHFHAGREDRTMAQTGEVRVPLVEERLVVGTRTIEMGDVEVRKTVESEHVSVPIELRRDQVAVDQIDVEERPVMLGEGLDAFEQGTIRVPVRGEEVIVSKEAVATGDVAIGREQISEGHTISETLRREVIDVAVSHNEARPESRQHVDRIQAQLRDAGGPTFRGRDVADAELDDRSLEDEDAWHAVGRDAREVASVGEAGDALRERDEVLRIPEVEEHLRVERRRIALGFVEIRKTVVTEQVMVPVELRREVVEYRLIDDPGGVATIGEAPGDLGDDTIRVPVFREKAVVHKEIVVTSEVVIDRTLTAERQTLEETLRRATVTVEDNTAPWEPARRHPERDDILGSDRGAGAYPGAGRNLGDEKEDGELPQRMDSRRRG
jgi:uncharacterized protein (TIGR02271 family)